MKALASGERRRKGPKRPLSSVRKMNLTPFFNVKRAINPSTCGFNRSMQHRRAKRTRLQGPPVWTRSRRSAALCSCGAISGRYSPTNSEESPESHSRLDQQKRVERREAIAPQRTEDVAIQKRRPGNRSLLQPILCFEPAYRAPSEHLSPFESQYHR